MDFDLPVEYVSQALTLARPLGECSLSSSPDSGTDDSNLEGIALRRRFSRLLSERMSAGGALLARVQRHRMPAKASSSAVDVKEANGPRAPWTKEQGTVFK